MPKCQNILYSISKIPSSCVLEVHDLEDSIGLRARQPLAVISLLATWIAVQYRVFK